MLDLEAQSRVALALALGHVRNAATGFLALDDAPGEALFLAAECMELECSLADVEPLFVEEGLSPRESLVAAVALVESDPRTARTLVVHTAIRAILSRAAS